MVRPKEREGIKSSLIVSEVQKRPSLFDTNHVNYGDRNEKAKSWEEVCERVVPEWNNLGIEQKFVAGKEVQKRWRSIRDSFTKSYRQGKCVLPENCHPGNRRMQYHRQMSFLLKVLQNKKPRFSCEKYESMSDLSNSPQHTLTDDYKLKGDHIEQTYEFKNGIDNEKKDFGTDKVEREFNLSLAAKNDKHQQTESIADHTNINNTFNPIENKVDTNAMLPNANFDDDKMFMSSLIPFFKKMDDDTRLVCRIEVLKVVRQALNGGGFNASSFEDKQMDKEKSSALSKADCLHLNMMNNKESTLSMVTRSADGSRPARKRMLHSPSPVHSPPKKRGPGRPRKIRPPSDSEDEDPKKKPKKLSSASIDSRSQEPRMSEYDRKINQATSVAQLETPVFMKMYNLERSKAAPEQTLIPSQTQINPMPTQIPMQVLVKTEPLDNDA